jgi:hypothetical protein
MTVNPPKATAEDPEKDLELVRKNRDLSFCDLVSVDQISSADLELIMDVAIKRTNLALIKAVPR